MVIKRIGFQYCKYQLHSPLTLVSRSLTLITTQFLSSKSRHKGDLCKLDRLGALNYYLLFIQFIAVDNN